MNYRKDSVKEVPLQDSFIVGSLKTSLSFRNEIEKGGNRQGSAEAFFDVRNRKKPIFYKV